MEIAFYALVLVMLALGRFDRIAWLFAALTLWSAAFWAGSLLWPGTVGDLPYQITPLLLMDHGCFFAFGGFIWLATKRRLSLGHWILVAVSVASCFVQIADQSLRLAVRVDAAPVWLPTLVWIAAMAALITSVAYADRLSSPRLVTTARALGLATYPLYLLHNIIGMVILRALSDQPWLALAIAIATVTALAFLVSMALEPRLQAQLNRALVARPGSDQLAIATRRQTRETGA